MFVLLLQTEMVLSHMLPQADYQGQTISQGP
jgi:hypothetical protein